MVYSIGEVAEMFDLPASTLRYYDKEGLFPGMQRNAGVRQFTEQEIETLQIIQCLKKSGLEIRDIRQFMDWCRQGRATYPLRRDLFRRQKEQVEREIRNMNQVLDMLTYRCWYYEQAMEDGSERRVRAAKPEDMPDEIRRAYENTH